MNPNVKSLEKLYWSGYTDWQTYREIAKTVIRDSLSVKGWVVFAVDGNPGLFDDVSWETYRLARKASIPVTIVSGISVLDVLPIDLHFDPGDVGLQVLEANQLVAYNVRMNPHLSSLILQVGWFGTSVLSKRPKKNRERFSLLVQHLLKFYARDHPAVFIFKGGKQVELIRTSVGEIGRYANQIHSGMTLYLPRRDVKIKNRAFYESLVP